MNDAHSDPPAAGGGTSSALDANPFVQAVAFAVVFLAAWISVDVVTPALGDAGDSAAAALLKNDETGIIAAQLCGFVAFLVLACLQAAATFAELRSNEARRPTWTFLFRAVGLPPRWGEKLAADPRPFADRVVLELALAQHAECRLALLRVTLAAFPTSGFIGTVIGIRQAIEPLDKLAARGDPAALSENLGAVVDGLELAFDTTLVGLLLLLVGSFMLAALTSYMRRVQTALLVAP